MIIRTSKKPKILIFIGVHDVCYICKQYAAAGACCARNLSRHFWAAYHRDYKRIEMGSGDELRDKLNKSNGGQI